MPLNVKVKNELKHYQYNPIETRQYGKIKMVEVKIQIMIVMRTSIAFVLSGLRKYS